MLLCGATGTVDHLLFECPVAKVVWGIIAIYFHKKYRPNSYLQFWPWIQKALPGGQKVVMFGLATISWAIWKAGLYM
jgi:hypothetical protein